MIKKIAIIGCGPAGLTAGYILSKRGYEVELFEASSSVGGMSKTIELWGQLVDLGPHRFFSQDPRVNKILFDVIDKDYAVVNRMTRIYYKNYFFNYPLKPFNALRGLGIIEAFRCIISFFSSKISVNIFHNKKNKNSFEDWVKSRFGKRLFEIFFKTYSEKLWGISCKNLDSDFAAQRIKKLSLFEAIKSSFFVRQNKKHKTLVDAFVYPTLGTGMIYERMKKKILENGGKVFLNKRIEGVNPKVNQKNQVEIIFADGLVKIYDEVISTMPITNLVKSMSKFASEQTMQSIKSLKFRNTILVYLEIKDKNIFPDQWIYIHDQSLKTGRITNFRNWTSSINKNKHETILCLEYWANDDSSIWSQSEEQLVSLASDEILKTGLVKKNTINQGFVLKIPKCYPIYQIGYKEKLDPIKIFLNSFKNISVIGRYGSFKYNNQDHSILMGLLAAENIADGKKHNLWDLNTDYEYQESGKLFLNKN
jgi:protoporphyrinogen oxidase